MDRSLLDTTTLSDLIQPDRKRSAITDVRLARYLTQWGQVTFSHVSCFEILRGLRKKQATVQIRNFEELCRRSELLPVTYAVFDRAAELWAAGQNRGITVEDADLIIAATALIENLAVATTNVRHFSWIHGLTVTDWREA